MAKSKPIYWGTARWSIKSTDHIIRSDWYDWQYCARGDDASWYKPRGDDASWCKLREDDASWCKSRGDDARWY